MAYSGIPKRTINAQDVVPTINASPQANTTGNITASAQTIVANDLTGVGSATVQFSGTYAGVNVTIEGSADGGTTWFPVQGYNQSTGAALTAGSTGVITTNATIVYTITPLLGLDQMRVRSTAFTSGSAAVVIHTSTQFTPTTISVVSAPTTTITGTVTANLGTGGTAATSLGKAEDAVHTSGDTGVMILAIRNDNAATAQTSASGDYSGVAVDINGTQFVRDSPANTPAKTNVTAAITSTTVLAANTARRSAILVNESTSDAYLSYGGTASSTSYTVPWVAGSTITISGAEYAGALVAIWNTATGTARVTETTI